MNLKIKKRSVMSDTAEVLTGGGVGGGDWFGFTHLTWSKLQYYAGFVAVL